MKFGWLSPEGKMHECDYYDHINSAYNLVKEYQIDSHKLTMDYDIITEDDMLLFSGWVKIGYDGSSGGYTVVTPELGNHKRGVYAPSITWDQKLYLKRMYDEEPDKFSGVWLRLLQELEVI